ncbi:MAG TPA: hypothetical protein VKI64_04360 [Acidimicrobiales bacterium]|nr:hypothetical protein [Acidimicrobiales bacterium]
MIGALALLAAACGSSGAKLASSTTTTTTTTGRGAALQAFRQCMAGHGVALPQRQRQAGGSQAGASASSQPPDTGGGGGFGRFNQPPPGVDPAKYQAALNACRSQLPAAGAGNAQFRTAFVAYVTCLRNHGVQTGDPSQGAQALAGVDRTSATFQAADQQCRALLPQRGPEATTTTTTA